MFRVGESQQFKPADLQVYRHDDYFKCLCGMHVHVGTFCLAILSLMHCLTWAVIGIGSTLDGDRDAESLLVLTVVAVVAMVPCGVLLAGNRMRRPNLYLPYIICMVSVILLLVVGAVAYFVWMVGFLAFGYSQLPTFMGGNGGRPTKQQKILVPLYWFGLLLVIYAHWYVLRVVRRGRRYLVDRES